MRRGALAEFASPVCAFEGCGLVLRDDVSVRQKFCSGRCRQAAYMARLRREIERSAKAVRDTERLAATIADRSYCPHCGHSLRRDG